MSILIGEPHYMREKRALDAVAPEDRSRVLQDRNELRKEREARLREKLVADLHQFAGDDLLQAWENDKARWRGRQSHNGKLVLDVGKVDEGSEDERVEEE